MEDTIAKQKAENDELRRKLEHMNEVFANAQRARFGQSSEKNSYVLHDQTIFFNEAEKEQAPKAEEPTPDTILVPQHERKKKRSQADMLNGLPEEVLLRWLLRSLSRENMVYERSNPAERSFTK